MTLHDADEKYIIVRLKSGEEFCGKAWCYTSELDNPEEKASLCIGNFIFFEDEVESIAEIENFIEHK